MLEEHRDYIVRVGAPPTVETEVADRRLLAWHRSLTLLSVISSASYCMSVVFRDMVRQCDSIRKLS